ncbi:ABC transporter ATP-binding protein [Mechercharimyces sp. CAU 1602]|uniref:ABC transporter ATP-binding protein n=1 Tax=Mechercharimyces sp. CAU 1602 TaxID=2973933 RepID=UPI0021632834|nr:ABC transporter ATP-binding protein [Mechercharimyces sp. CAU 1602]MCS1350019.1 ABC transporter ATP-binding protein [Mechercharimyces sp. CAU 1602]
MKREEPILKVEGLSKCIGKQEIVSDLSFEVGAGEIFGFLGPNGAGKTTTIRMLVGLISPTKGNIHIGGYHLRRQFLQAIGHVGSIVENPEMYPYLTGRENLEVFARMQQGVTPARIMEVAQLVELEKRIDDKVGTYSLGMRQRLGIAQALLGNPKLLILDEPTNGLDPAGIKEMRHFIRALSRDHGMSVFVSSHILHEVQLLCDRVSIIHEGKIVKTGRVEQLLEGEVRVDWSLHPYQQAQSVLSTLPYVSQVDVLDSSRISTLLPVENIAQVNQTLVEAGIEVMEVRQRGNTLEDIFLDLTGGSASA